jgi:beta-lactamase regulating signal transducer with metallopeptidase domain
MPDIIQYLLKLFISLTLVHFFYQVVLRKLTFYTWNRWYLLLYSFISFIIPFINIAFLLEKNQWKNIEAIHYIPLLEKYTPVSPSVETVSAGFNVWNVLMFIMIVGIFIMLVRLSIQYLSVRKITKSAVLLHDEKLKLYHVDRNIIPFSFGNAIFVNRDLHTEADLKEIIRHEFVHVKQRHSIDILWSEFLCIINWYNPIAWLLRKAIRQNLEFIADNNVIQNGFDRKQYQFLLLKVTGVSNFSIANKFNYSSIKKRIAMMNKMKSARLNLVRFLFVLPLVAILLLAFRKNQSGISSISIEQNVMDTLPAGTKTISPDNINDKGYYIDIIDVKGHCTVVVKNKSKKIIEQVDLLKWNDNKKHYENIYGIIPPPIPPVPEIPSISVTASTAVKTDVALTTPVITTNEAIVSIKNSPNIVQVNSVATTSVSVTSQANIANMSQVRPVTTTSASVSAKSSSAVAVSPVEDAPYDDESRPAIGPEDFQFQIYRTTTREELNQMIIQAKEKGATLTFDEVKYNQKNQLISLSGTFKNKDDHSDFKATDFHKLILTMIRKNGRSHFYIMIKEREVT